MELSIGIWEISSLNQINSSDLGIWEHLDQGESLGHQHPGASDSDSESLDPGALLQYRSGSCPSGIREHQVDPGAALWYPGNL